MKRKKTKRTLMNFLVRPCACGRMPFLLDSDRSDDGMYYIGCRREQAGCVSTVWATDGPAALKAWNAAVESKMGGFSMTTSGPQGLDIRINQNPDGQQLIDMQASLVTLVLDLEDTDGDRNPETGEVYSSHAQARQTLEQYGILKPREEDHEQQQEIGHGAGDRGEPARHALQHPGRTDTALDSGAASGDDAAGAGQSVGRERDDPTIDRRQDGSEELHLPEQDAGVDG